MKLLSLQTKEKENDFLKNRIESLELSKKLTNILLDNNIRTIGGLIKRDDRKLKKELGISENEVNIIEKKIDELMLEAVVASEKSIPDNFDQDTESEVEEKTSIIIDAGGEDDIIEFFSKSLGATKDEVESSSRRQDLVKVRDLIIYLLREYGEMSYPAIGRLLGGRDHTTVIHSYKKVAENVRKSKNLEKDLVNLISKAKELKERKSNIEKILIPEIFDEIRKRKSKKEIELREIPERNIKILDLYREGLTLENIGRVFKITRERVRQVAEATIKQIAINEAISKEIEVDTSIVFDEEKKRRKIAKGFELKPPKIEKIKEQRWSRYYLSCKSCGTTTIPHVRHGLCEKCVGQFVGNTREQIISSHNNKCDSCGVFRHEAITAYGRDFYIMKDQRVFCKKCFLSRTGRKLGGYKNYIWSRFHEKCQSCGTTSTPHFKKGLCINCASHITNEEREKIVNQHGNKCDNCFLSRNEARKKFGRDFSITKSGEVLCRKCFLSYAMIKMRSVKLKQP